jgi:type II secretory ATPase GspE/PulE/Tfp pilus assembly ATPase PilB-like protein
MGLDAELRHEIIKGAPQNELMSIAKSKGMRTLDMAAIQKVTDGITTIEEMHRVLT